MKLFRIPSNSPPGTPAAHSTMTVFVFCLIVAGFVFMMLSKTTNATFSFTEDSLEIKGTHAATVPLAAVQEVTLTDKPPLNPQEIDGGSYGTRYNGTFTTDNYGTVQLYLDTSKPPFLLFKTPDRVFVINDKDSKATQALYEKLTKGNTP